MSWGQAGKMRGYPGCGRPARTHVAHHDGVTATCTYPCDTGFHGVFHVTVCDQKLPAQVSRDASNDSHGPLWIRMGSGKDWEDLWEVFGHVWLGW